MDLTQFVGNGQREFGELVRRYDYEDGTVVAADLGTSDAAVDVVGQTAIVVVGDEQFEVELPAAGARAFIRNGVLTIEVEG
jgi:hypothetical protein